ncbi:cell division protein FtsI [soil metagenome]
MAAPPITPPLRRRGRRRRGHPSQRVRRPGTPPLPQGAPLGRMVLLSLYDSLARAQQKARISRRLMIMLVAYLLLTLVMGWRLVAVQLVDAEVYAGWQHRQTQREVQLPASRGALTDRQGAPLAMSLAASTVYANPPVLAEAGVDPAVIAQQLAGVMPGGDVDAMIAALNSSKAFVYLGRQLPREIGQAVAELRLPGIGVLEEPKRVYPADSIASQVVGWAGLDNKGLAGIELQYDEALRGIDGKLRLETAPGGVEISAAPREVVPAEPGVDLRLTIDREVQYATEEILFDAVERYAALGGSAVVMDVDSNEILAMASVPSVAPQDYADANSYARRNRALTDVFEPGSVNKVITIAGALEDGVVGADEGFSVPSALTLGSETFNDASPHADAWWSTRDIITRSSNVGTIQIAQRLGEQRLYDYVTDFGLGQPTGLRFPGESRGILAPVEDWTASSLPTIAIGQGVAATLVQTAEVFNVIASGGYWEQPRLVQGFVTNDDSFTPAPPPQRRQVLSPTTAQTVADMLVQVVESPDGTGGLAAVPGYRVGGKTGTAQKPKEGERGYATDAYIATFVGFAPADDPRVTVAVMLDEPTPSYGGLSAAPTFAEIMQFALRDQRVPPQTPSVPVPIGQETTTVVGRQQPITQSGEAVVDDG